MSSPRFSVLRAHWVSQIFLECNEFTDLSFITKATRILVLLRSRELAALIISFTARGHVYFLSLDLQPIFGDLSFACRFSSSVFKVSLWILSICNVENRSGASVTKSRRISSAWCRSESWPRSIFMMLEAPLAVVKYSLETMIKTPVSWIIAITLPFSSQNYPQKNLWKLSSTCNSQRFRHRGLEKSVNAGVFYSTSGTRYHISCCT